jgi:hypothetical protein
MRFSKLAKRNRKTPFLYCNAINHNHFRQAYIFLGTNGTIEQYKYIYINIIKTTTYLYFILFQPHGTFWNKWNTILEQSKHIAIKIRDFLDTYIEGMGGIT